MADPIDIIITIGWWAGVIGGVVALVIFIVAAIGEMQERRYRPAARILEYLSGKREWVPGSEISAELDDIPGAMIYVTLNRLEDEGAVISERRGEHHPRRYYRATGTRRPDENVSSQQVFAHG